MLGTHCSYFLTILKRPGNFVATCKRKCIALPGRKLRTSIKIDLDGILAAQVEGLPLPLPIREPITFFVIGICGKDLTHKYLFVILDRRTDFFKNIFILNKCLLNSKKLVL